GVEDAYDGFPNDPDRWADADFDGIEDGLDDDIDGDGLDNARELADGTYPYKADSDGDGADDFVELEAQTDPLDPRSF
ncbi:MAG: thrombospondin type 3 repeat-containing protein, partial [Pseudomonadota bacterium]